MVRWWWLIMAMCSGQLMAVASHQLMLEPPEIPTRVKFNATLIKVDEIQPASVEQPMLTAQFQLETSWNDERPVQQKFKDQKIHSFQDSDVEKILNQIFSPNIKVLDGSTEIRRQRLWIYPDGRVKQEQYVVVKVPANLNLERFPFDKQTLVVRFASSFWDDEHIDMINESAPITMQENMAPTSWQFNYLNSYISKTLLEDKPEPFPTFNYQIHAQRNPNYFIWRLLLPLMVIVVLSWHVFWVFEDQDMALANCFLFLLTLVTFHQFIREWLPIIPYFTFMDAFVYISDLFIIVPTLQVVIAVQFERAGKMALVERLRGTCQWLVPMLYIMTIAAATLKYFAG